MKKNAFNYLTNETLDLIDSLSKVNFDDLPKFEKIEIKVGIYFLLKNNEIVYVGKTINLEQRIMSHQMNNKKDFDNFLFFKVDSEKLDLCERYFINKLKPIYNNDSLTKKLRTNEIQFSN